MELASRTAAVKGFNVLRVVTQLLRTDRKRVSCRLAERGSGQGHGKTRAKTEYRSAHDLGHELL